MDENTKNYRQGELHGLVPYDTDTESYRVKVIGGDGTETKWLSITEEELADIKGILTGDAVNTALHILTREGYAVKCYGAEDVHEVLDQYADGGKVQATVDTETYRDEITAHIMEGDDWAGILDTDDVPGYLWCVIEGTHNDHPEWFPEDKPENPLADVTTPELISRYVTMRVIIATPGAASDSLTTQYMEVSTELRERGIIY